MGAHRRFKFLGLKFAVTARFVTSHTSVALLSGDLLLLVNQICILLIEICLGVTYGCNKVLDCGGAFEAVDFIWSFIIKILEIIYANH